MSSVRGACRCRHRVPWYYYYSHWWDTQTAKQALVGGGTWVKSASSFPQTPGYRSTARRANKQATAPRSTTCDPLFWTSVLFSILAQVSESKLKNNGRAYRFEEKPSVASVSPGMAIDKWNTSSLLWTRNLVCFQVCIVVGRNEWNATQMIKTIPKLVNTIGSEV